MVTKVQAKAIFNGITIGAEHSVDGALDPDPTNTIFVIDFADIPEYSYLTDTFILKNGETPITVANIAFADSKLTATVLNTNLTGVTDCTATFTITKTA